MALLVVNLTAACAPSSPLWGVYETPTPRLGSAQVQGPSGMASTAAITAGLPGNQGLPATPEIESSAQPAQQPQEGAAPATVTPTFAGAPILYYTQSGDTLPSLARRFSVSTSEVNSSSVLPQTGLIDAGTLLVIPDRIETTTTPNIEIMPDNEVIFSATGLDFDVQAFVEEASGYLLGYRDYPGSIGWLDGDEVIQQLAIQNSINPRLLLGILEYESRWVRGEPVDVLHAEYPMGFQDFRYKGLYIQMAWAINQIASGYYGWRAGTLTELGFPDGSRLRIDPRLNAGTVAIQYLFSRLHSQSRWGQIMDPGTGFPAMYEEMFGDPWVRADLVNPILPPDLAQPPLALPYEPKVEWSLTGGPHNAWGRYRESDVGSNASNVELYGALAALDFAPATDHGGCEITPVWILAGGPGLVVRAGGGVVMVDMDGDGFEQTGWNILYMHVATKDRLEAGTWVETNDRIGHPSCEGGASTGTHLHFVRKYNGEWIAADGPVPMVLDGWRAVAGLKPYEGQLIRGDQIVTADPVGQKWSNLFRDANLDDEDSTSIQ